MSAPVAHMEARVIAGGFVELKGGLLVSFHALNLALALENTGHALTAQDGVLLVSNGATLTAEERAAIKQQRMQLLAIAGYEPPATR